MYRFYNWTERTILLFSDTEALLLPQYGNPAKTLFLDSVSEGPRECSGAQRQRHVIYGNLP